MNFEDFESFSLTILHLEKSKSEKIEDLKLNRRRKSDEYASPVKVDNDLMQFQMNWNQNLLFSQDTSMMMPPDYTLSDEQSWDFGQDFEHPILNLRMNSSPNGLKVNLIILLMLLLGYNVTL